MQLVLGPGGAALHICLDLPAAEALQLQLTAAGVAASLTSAPKLKLADKHVRCASTPLSAPASSPGCC